jgi:hypothetical protein
MQGFVSLANGAALPRAGARYATPPPRLGDNAQAFLAGLQNKHPHHCGFHARRILMLKECYSAEDIDRACGRARRYHAFDADAVGRIVHAMAKPRTLESVRNDKARLEPEKALPIVKQRNLAEYSHLLNKDKPDEDSRTDTGQNPRSPEDSQTHQNGQGA